LLAYRLALPKTYHIYNVFYVLLLEPYKGSVEEAYKYYEKVEVKPEEE
jgi:hypothetical protein